MIKKRTPQMRCKCGHAKNKHYQKSIHIETRSETMCCYCFNDCIEFKMDNLTTLERLSVYEESKNS